MSQIAEIFLEPETQVEQYYRKGLFTIVELIIKSKIEQNFFLNKTNLDDSYLRAKTLGTGMAIKWIKFVFQYLVSISTKRNKNKKWMDVKKFT